MNQQQVDNYIAQNTKYFPADKVPMIREKLLALPDDRFAAVSAVELKDPMTLLLISIFVGSLGVDRFMLGDTGMGVVKLLTCGGCYVLWIMDMINAQNRAKEFNFNKLMMVQ